MSRFKSTVVVAAMLLLAVSATATLSPQSLPETDDWLDGSDDTTGSSDPAESSNDTESNETSESSTDTEPESADQEVNYTTDFQYGPDACESGADDDGLNMSEESRYGTNPCANDTDGDGLSDYAEVNREALSESNPTRMDVFVELDYMNGTRPKNEEIQKVVEAYANSPVDNPDGSNGIDLHIVVDDAVPAQSETDTGDVFETMETHFDHDGDGYRYGLVVNDALSDGSNEPLGIAISTHATEYNAFFAIEKSTYVENGGNTSATLMHELGHSVGLYPRVYRGIDSRYTPAEYDSVMRYDYRELDYNHGEPFDDWEYIENSMVTPEVTNESAQAMNSSA